MIFTMFTVSLVPTFGLAGFASDIRIQYTHIHEHTDHDHEDKDDVASTSEDESQAEQHGHELVISALALTFIESRSNLVFTFSLSAKLYPKFQDDKLPLSHYLHSIFRPPISA